VRAALRGSSALLISEERRVLAYLTVAALSRSFKAANVSTCLIHVSKFWRPLYIGGRGALMLILCLLLGRSVEADAWDPGDGGGPEGILWSGDPIGKMSGERSGDPNGDLVGRGGQESWLLKASAAGAEAWKYVGGGSCQSFQGKLVSAGVGLGGICGEPAGEKAVMKDCCAKPGVRGLEDVSGRKLS